MNDSGSWMVAFNKTQEVRRPVLHTVRVSLLKVDQLPDSGCVSIQGRVALALSSLGYNGGQNLAVPGSYPDSESDGASAQWGSLAWVTKGG